MSSSLILTWCEMSMNDWHRIWDAWWYLHSAQHTNDYGSSIGHHSSSRSWIHPVVSDMLNLGKIAWSSPSLYFYVGLRITGRKDGPVIWTRRVNISNSKSRRGILQTAEHKYLTLPIQQLRSKIHTWRVLLVALNGTRCADAYWDVLIIMNGWWASIQAPVYGFT